MLLHCMRDIVGGAVGSASWQHLPQCCGLSLLCEWQLPPLGICAARKGLKEAFAQRKWQGAAMLTGCCMPHAHASRCAITAYKMSTPLDSVAPQSSTVVCLQQIRQVREWDRRSTLLQDLVIS